MSQPGYCRARNRAARILLSLLGQQDPPLEKSEKKVAKSATNGEALIGGGTLSRRHAPFWLHLISSIKYIKSIKSNGLPRSCLHDDHAPVRHIGLDLGVRLLRDDAQQGDNLSLPR